VKNAAGHRSTWDFRVWCGKYISAIAWARIASLADEHAPILTQWEAADGERRLAALMSNDQ